MEGRTEQPEQEEQEPVVQVPLQQAVQVQSPDILKLVFGGGLKWERVCVCV